MVQFLSFPVFPLHQWQFNYRRISGTGIDLLLMFQRIHVAKAAQGTVLWSAAIFVDFSRKTGAAQRTVPCAALCRVFSIGFPS